MSYFVTFTAAERSLALPLDFVEKVIQVVELGKAPQESDLVLGMINFHGKYLTVVDLGKKFGSPHGEINLEDRIIIARTKKFHFGLLVRKVLGVVEGNLQGPGGGEGDLAILSDDLILIQDPALFLGLDKVLVHGQNI